MTETKAETDGQTGPEKRFLEDAGRLDGKRLKT
jgi:hypothetical protein